MTDAHSSQTPQAAQAVVIGLELLDAVRNRGADLDVVRHESSVSDQALGGSAKRVVDIIVASLAFLVLLPLIGMIILLLLVTMGRPVFYAHERIGFGGKPFGCLKFRSMVNDPGEALRRHFLAHPEAEQEWVETQKLRDDPRTTFVGRMLRKSSLDELPQLLNVLRGEMSCVGPRPVIAAELDRYGEKEALYKSVRPGMTGLWQVSGRSSVDYDRRVALDEAYIQSWSIWLDLKILAKTLPAVAKVNDAA